MNIPASAEVMFGLAGAVRLARFDPSGLAFFVNSGAGALRSFWAMAIILPAYIALLLVQGDLAQVQAPASQVMAVESIRYIVNCTAFPVLMSHLVTVIGREPRYSLFVCAYNWSAPVQMAVILPAAFLAYEAGLPALVGEGLLVGVTLVMMAYQVFIFRVTLLLTWRGAIALAVVDMLLSALIGDIATAIEMAV